MENISLILYTKGFFGSVLKSPTLMGSLSINNSVTNISRLGTFKCNTSSKPIPLLSMNNYTSLVISGIDKNKQVTLWSKCKLLLTARMQILRHKVIGPTKKNLKMARSLFRPKSNHTCHQSPNQSCESPFKVARNNWRWKQNQL